MMQSFSGIPNSVNLGRDPVVRGLDDSHATGGRGLAFKVVDADLGPGFAMGRATAYPPVLLVCYQGAAELREGGATAPRRLEAGQAVYVPLGCSLFYGSVAGSRFGHFGLEWFDPAGAPVADGVTWLRADVLPFRCAWDGYFHERWVTGDPAMGLDWVRILERLGRRTVQAGAGGSLGTRLQPLLVAMQREPGRDWRVATMGALLNMSESSVRRLFHAETGAGPLEALQRVRMEAAAALLSATDLTLQDIAVQVGFASPFSLSRAFAKHHGRAPSEYRRAQQQRG